MLVLAALCASAVWEKQITIEGNSYAVRLDPAAKRPLQVWSAGRKIAEALSAAYHPWALELADVDGKGRQEICVGLTKPTHQFKFPHRTIFVMRFDGERLVRKWAGSTMGRPLLEFCFGPRNVGEGQVLFTLESTIEGQVALSANRWMGFGFRKVGKQQVWKRARSLRLESESLILNANGKRVSIPWKSLL